MRVIVRPAPEESIGYVRWLKKAIRAEIGVGTAIVEYSGAEMEGG